MKDPVAKPLFVSVVIPLKEIGYYAQFENLPSFPKQTYPHFEVILLPNAPAACDHELTKKYPFLRIIPTGQITRPAQKRNLGVKQAKGDIIAFIDDDAYPSSHWLERAIALFQQKNVTAVCGPGVVPPNVNMWEEAFDAVLQSFVGVGGYTYRFTPGHPRFVDDYPSMNLLIEKTVFNKIGGFDNDYWPGEDSKLCEELVNHRKQQIFYHPDVLIYHHRRNNLTAYLKQHAQYGFHRGAFFVHGDTNSRRLSYLIPTFLVLYLVVLLFFVVWQWWACSIRAVLFAFMPLYAYGILLAYFILKTAIVKKNVLIALFAAIALVLTHLVYGILFVKGLVTGLLLKENIYS